MNEANEMDQILMAIAGNQPYRIVRTRMIFSASGDLIERKVLGETNCLDMQNKDGIYVANLGVEKRSFVRYVVDRFKQIYMR